MLDDALEGTRAIFRLVTQIGDRVESGVGDREVDSLFREKRLELFRLNLDDLTNLILFQRMENDRFVDTIEEFGEELVAQHEVDRVFKFFRRAMVRRYIANDLASEV